MFKKAAPTESISKDRQRYLKQVTYKKYGILTAQIMILVILMALWEICANLGIIDSFITSQPSRILKTFLNLAENSLMVHLGVTCFETIVGFLLGVGFGIVCATLLWLSLIHI